MLAHHAGRIELGSDTARGPGDCTRAEVREVRGEPFVSERAVLAGVVLCALFVAWATIFGSLTLATVFGAVALLAAPFGILVRALAREIALGPGGEDEGNGDVVVTAAAIDAEGNVIT